MLSRDRGHKEAAFSSVPSKGEAEIRFGIAHSELRRALILGIARRVRKAVDNVSIEEASSDISLDKLYNRKLLIIHNPQLYPEPLETEAFYDHLDLLPTILDLAGVPQPDSYALGKSIVPVIRDPSQSVQSATIFSYDDVFFVPAGFPGGHIRAIREGDWIYAVYFGLDGSGLAYELYNIKSDAGQLNNLAYGEPTADVKREWSRLHRMLTARFIDTGNLPDDFPWPVEPVKA